jgi:PIN domain nuclease of toxin-antitoxin system
VTVVLDACAVLAYLNNEEGADLVEDILANETCYMHSVNICEVFYNVNSVRGPEPADEALKWLLDIVGIRRVAEDDAEIIRSAGLAKCALRIALADCFCIALARRVSAPVVTADRAEFEPALAGGLCEVRFIR